MNAFHEEEVLGKAYDARLMRRLLAYLRPHKWFVVGALVALIGDAVTQLAPPYLVKIAIDQYIAQGDLAGINQIGLAYLAVLVASFSLEYGQTYMMQMIGQRIMFDMRMQIYAHLQRLDLAFYDRNPVGRLMTRVTTDVDVINDLFTSGVVAAFGDLFMLAGIMVTLLWMDWRLALIAFSVLPLIVMLAQWFRRNVRESYRKVRLRIARINAFLNEHINGMMTVQLFRREEVNYGRFEFINREHRDANIEQIFFYAVFLPAVEFVAAIATGLILWYGGGFVMAGTLTLGSLVAFIYAGRFRPISDMSEKFNTLRPRWRRRNGFFSFWTLRSL
jgi:ATP-binding cassette subfamily B protein